MKYSVDDILICKKVGLDILLGKKFSIVDISVDNFNICICSIQSEDSIEYPIMYFPETLDEYFYNLQEHRKAIIDNLLS